MRKKRVGSYRKATTKNPITIWELVDRTSLLHHYSKCGQEQWRSMPGNPSYSISSYGRVQHTEIYKNNDYVPVRPKLIRSKVIPETFDIRIKGERVHQSRWEAIRLVYGVDRLKELATFFVWLIEETKMSGKIRREHIYINLGEL